MSKVQTRQPAPIVRTCDLCGQPWAIQPEGAEHRKAHLSKKIAFVCQVCAAQVRLEVEAAGKTMQSPQVSA